MAGSMAMPGQLNMAGRGNFLPALSCTPIFDLKNPDSTLVMAAGGKSATVTP